MSSRTAQEFESNAASDLKRILGNLNYEILRLQRKQEALQRRGNAGEKLTIVETRLKHFCCYRDNIELILQGLTEDTVQLPE